MWLTNKKGKQYVSFFCLNSQVVWNRPSPTPQNLHLNINSSPLLLCRFRLKYNPNNNYSNYIKLCAITVRLHAGMTTANLELSAKKAWVQKYSPHFPPLPHWAEIPATGTSGSGRTAEDDGGRSCSQNKSRTRRVVGCGKQPQNSKTNKTRQQQSRPQKRLQRSKIKASQQSKRFRPTSCKRSSENPNPRFSDDLSP